MSFGIILAVAAIAFVAGAVNGIAGFGFAVVGTMALALVFDPATAVVFMIAPLVAVNLSLVGELGAAELQSCGRRFGPLILAATAGTLVGMALLGRLPEAPLRVALGVVSLSFVATSQRLVTVPGIERARDGCFVETPLAMTGVGAVSGILFGATNVGVQLVAYVRSCNLSHGLFVGVLALIFLGINFIRIGAAAILGLYPDLTVVAASAAAVVPAVAGVAVGKRLRHRFTERTRRTAVLGLLTIVGLRLLADGVGAV